MARRQSKIELTLFPFLSVLTGLIAVLVLFMIVILGTRVVAAEGAKPTRLSDKTHLEERLDLEKYNELRHEVDRLARLLRRQEEERDRLALLQESLLDRLDFKRTESALTERAGSMQKGARLGTQSPVEFVPSTAHPNKKRPVYVEVKAHGYVVHPERVSYPPIAADSVERYRVDSRLQSFLNEVDRKRDNFYLVLLLHPSGVDALRQLRAYLKHTFPKPVRVMVGGKLREATMSRIDVGSEPFSREWLLWTE